MLRKILLVLSAMVMSLNTMQAQDEEEAEFIFDPEGTSQIYSMSLYCYDQTQQQFQHATSIKSELRWADDGKTVYLKDITKSLGVETWLQGTLDGDTIRIPFGQPLVYYKGSYLVFFCPMAFDDTSGDLIAQDEFKLVVSGDSLISPMIDDRLWQAAAGYVVISEAKQGFLSLDVAHEMRYVADDFATSPDDILPDTYIYKYETSRGETKQKKINVKLTDDDIWMQLSNSAPDYYIHGTLVGDSIQVESGQLVTDGNFLYWYSLADPIYEGEELIDFVPTSETRLSWDADNCLLGSASDLLSVDYMDGMEECMNFVFHPQLSPYKGDCLAQPMAPKFYSISLDTSMPYVCFDLTNLAVDSTLINTDSLTYRLYFDDDLYTFYPETYMMLKEPMTDVPFAFADNFDFWVTGERRYVYLYENLFSTIGIQTKYTIDGESMLSDIVTYDTETGEITTTPPTDLQHVITDICRPLTPHLIYDLMGRRVKTPHSGLFISHTK